jgi:RNA polymerase sigma-70 factor (ECF subfamily)
MSVAPSQIARVGGSEGAISCGVLGLFSREEHSRLGEREKIVDFYDELRPSLYGYLISRRLMPQEADDVVQETFLRLFRFVQSGGKVENMRSWIFRVAHNLASNLQKRERRLVCDESEGGESVRIDKSDSALDPEELCLRKEQSRLLAIAISQLPERQQECLHLRAEGLRYREIAEVLGGSVSGVADSLRRAVVHLVSELYE